MILALHQEGLPDYWGIETITRSSFITTGGIYQEGLPDYWGIETLPALRCSYLQKYPNQEGLPDYWGIETSFLRRALYLYSQPIRKDYPTTGVLRLFNRWGKRNAVKLVHQARIRKDYPTTGVLRLNKGYVFRGVAFYQEGLPDYWGIETYLHPQLYDQGRRPIRKDYPTTGVLRPIPNPCKTHCYILNQEGLPDYWGIETCRQMSVRVRAVLRRSGRITRLLGY